VYNITTSPKVIEDGFNAAIKLMGYLAADGYKITTPLFTLKMRIPGEYDGAETYLPSGVFPTARLQVNATYSKYLKENVQILIDGKDDAEGFIAQATDEATGLIDETANRQHTYHPRLRLKAGDSPRTPHGRGNLL
jgi:hypothetical protein